MKLHLGCGRRYIPGFFHVDASAFEHLDHKGDISDLQFLDDNSVELIYCCHAFEYFDRQEAESVLREWKRVLRAGGLLRLAVPDFAALVDLYRETGEIARVLGPLYGKISGESGKPIYHRTAYDFPSLENLLRDAGFQDISRYDWRKTEHASIDDFSQAYYPHLHKEQGKLLSLNVECRKL